MEENDKPRIEMTDVRKNEFDGARGLEEHVSEFRKQLEELAQAKEEYPDRDDLFVYIGTLTKEGDPIQRFLHPKSLVRLACNNANSLSLLQASYLPFQIMIETETEVDNKPPAHFLMILEAIRRVTAEMTDSLCESQREEDLGQNGVTP